MVELTEAQVCLGRMYRFIHERAEYLRTRKREAAANSANLAGSELAAARTPITKNSNQPPETSPADS